MRDLMNRGKIEQIAAPQDLYQRPATEYVATFIGLNPNPLYEVPQIAAPLISEKATNSNRLLK